MKRCAYCKYSIHYYRGKNKKPNCLKMAFCEHPKAPEKSGKPRRPRKWLATYRDDLIYKIKTHPRWCPLSKIGRVK